MGGIDHGTIDCSTLRMDSYLYGLSGNHRRFVGPRLGPAAAGCRASTWTSLKNGTVPTASSAGDRSFAAGMPYGPFMDENVSRQGRQRPLAGPDGLASHGGVARAVINILRQHGAAKPPRSSADLVVASTTVGRRHACTLVASVIPTRIHRLNSSFCRLMAW